MRSLLKTTLIALGVLSVLLSCQTDQKSVEEGDRQEQTFDAATFTKQSRTAAAMTQAALLAAVGAAIEEGGFHGAVDYCNLSATGLTDSLSEAYDLNISRISTRYRNPNNKLTSQEDKRAWSYYQTKTASTSAADTVLHDRAGNATYYKPIWLGAELCLNCHGSRSTEIALETLEAIDARYPSDAAVNYTLGDLRGLWKVN